LARFLTHGSIASAVGEQACPSADQEHRFEKGADVSMFAVFDIASPTLGEYCGDLLWRRLHDANRFRLW
jgi:hypothetical protein